MRYLSLIILALATIIYSCTPAQVSQQTKAEETKWLTHHVHVLAADSMEGRNTGTIGETKAANYIAMMYEKFGVAPMGDNGTYFQHFEHTLKNNPHAAMNDPENVGSKVIKGKNVVGFMDRGYKKTVIIGAHYDHLGWGHPGSLYRGEPAIHNGADDNASGVSIMLELARDLKNSPVECNFLFIAFSGEEHGLWGSNYFCKNPTIDLNTASYMINMDMVGRLKEDNTLAINATGTSTIWKKQLKKTNRLTKFKIIYGESGVGPSDHTSFYLVDLPVLQFFTGQHDDYHKPSDDIEKINYEGMWTIKNYIYRLIVNVDDREVPFQKTIDENETPRFTVTLGVVPDYLFDGKGMRIDGVTEGKPASNSGLVKGDIVVKLGETEVVDMMSYMKALSNFEKGDATKVVIKRGEEELEFDVQF